VLQFGIIKQYLSSIFVKRKSSEIKS